MIKIDAVTKYISSFTIIHRVFFILLIVVLMWILIILIYLMHRLTLRFISNLTTFYHKSSSSSSVSNGKIYQTMVITSNQYGSIQPIIKTSDHFSNSNLTLNNKQIKTISSDKNMNLTINHYSNLINNSQYQQSKTNLLNHYLKSYNPLQIDLTTSPNQETLRTDNVKAMSYEELSSETSTHPIENCYSIYCTNKQKLHQSKRYIRLKEQENCSATLSIIDDRSSQCSAKLTATILPIVMITDCSDSQRLHTDIIEMNDKE